jgi:hypothetical protein
VRRTYEVKANNEQEAVDIACANCDEPDSEDAQYNGYEIELIEDGVDKEQQDIVERLCNRYGILESRAKDIINMVESVCSTRGAALLWIDQYINKHELH